jgi:3-oxoacyl-[acyl-carrier protein] reductase
MKEDQVSKGILDGKVAFVTGGAVGIGRGIVKALSDAGASVAFTWREHAVEGKELLASLEELGRPALGIELDVTISDDVESAIDEVVARFGALDILVNNAGGLIAREAVHSMSNDLWRRVIDVNLSSAFFCARAVVPRLPIGGRIINVSSLAAHNGGGEGNTAYAAAKAGMLGLTRALAKELAPRRITVNAVAPGLILDTPFHEKFTPLEAQASAIAGLPLGRAGYPDDVAGAVSWLCTTAAEWITGEVLNINGGQYFS